MPDIRWHNGTAIVEQSEGATVSVFWHNGTAYAIHEYTGGAPPAGLSIPVAMDSYRRMRT